MNELYAHTPNEKNEWHYLVLHLKEVAELAKQFADKFSAGNLAYWIGLWHDLGKSNPKFQNYLKACRQGESHETVPHAIWGAALVYLLLTSEGKEGRWEEIALAIAGHHSGIGQPGTLSQRFVEQIKNSHNLCQQMLRYAKKLPSLPSVNLPELTNTQKELFIRMVFSALVDADYLNTEKHFNEKQYILRRRLQGIKDLWFRFNINQKQLMSSVDTKTQINKIRKEVYELCDEAATGKSGVYRMTVPTGGGKTRSGLAFALKHAIKNQMERIIVSIPYTSIIDQTAKEFRKIFGYNAVLEHHSQVGIPTNENEDAGYVWLRIASENWDAPLIVTTTVQLFESLFSNKPGKIRKLHNLSRSVIVIDEVQTLPPELLTPTLDVLREIVENYGATVLLSTATQPVFEESYYLKPFQGLKVHEIVPAAIYKKHFEELRRVEYHRIENQIS